ncbi:MAG TPA: class I tRNA ligase family protein [Chloroflexota bacterium]|nr:class I tRNA ligase family protein [Chloroflexota bacterium]
MLERYSADAVRYWTAGVRVGADTMMSEDAFHQGKRLVTKLWNAARFVSLRAALLAVLKLLAPVLPFVTEEIYLRDFAELDGAPSIHRAAWPDRRWYPPDLEAERAGAAMRAMVETVRRWKAERSLSVGAPLARLIVAAPADTAPLLQAMADDLQGITRAEHVALVPGEGAMTLVEIGST